MLRARHPKSRFSITDKIVDKLERRFCRAPPTPRQNVAKSISGNAREFCKVDRFQRKLQTTDSLFEFETLSGNRRYNVTAQCQTTDRLSGMTVGYSDYVTMLAALPRWIAETNSVKVIDITPSPTEERRNIFFSWDSTDYQSNFSEILVKVRSSLAGDTL
ncbi:hypothetical protein HZH68_016118 [Vespula germanica]|uniref:Uncharacterized protein n=1 Tax=Vespula germanica TaxID=30212 RepID=A0A834MSF6_VESGE|nr:hypothetical protein HZH68_016118 [Vespula germanica]